ncbi:DUF2624 domain-containing protein [Virgibacillus sp. 179-BFC.A HS]|uniref:DUF2624 domain-containing protein n=1 Tax=Tigheibacillus jepli TaxID=3035914 RepID=A0ABU5CGW8_9BACI|nr:DUF2624 domain-containing protein [Virgibacillus sp. 179-BFC.A HS]MDY0405555.1 DUF2624 domain-containing protein [Virgibacillus sp. 179-BFC.A HS]
MSILFKELINQRLKKLSVAELLNYSKQYGFSLNKTQGRQIISYLKTHSIDPFSKKERQKMLADLSAITDKETAEKANRLFKEMIETYGLSDLFEP